MKKKKFIILLMSCNQPLYIKEEQACRDTFLKDAETASIPYWFYKGVSEEHPEPGFDEETHTLYLNVPDNLAGTGKKTVAALEAILDQDFDYVIKTNVSTYLNIKNVVNGTRNWDGKDDLNIYGGRFIINDASKKVPFPRGYFSIMSKTMTEGVVKCAKALLQAKGTPKTDDTLLCLATLYHMKKNLNEDYVGHQMQVPSVIEWTEDVIENPVFDRAFAIRCKNEEKPEETPENLMTVDWMLGEKARPSLNYRVAKEYETPMGLMSYKQYLTTGKLVTKLAEVKKMLEERNEPKQQPPVQQEQQEVPDKMAEIKERIKGLL